MTWHDVASSVHPALLPGGAAGDQGVQGGEAGAGAQAGGAHAEDHQR